MLLHLRARNLGLIRDASIEPGPGLTVITGETGAGKTLLLGAVRLLAGETSDSSSVGGFDDACQADALFDLDGEVGVTRVVPKNGRSRAYLDGKLVAASALTEKLAPSLQVVGQHDQLELRRPRFVLDLVDSNLDPGGQAHLVAYATAWDSLQKALEEQKLLGGSRLELARELDLAEYQLAEINNAGFDHGDDIELDTQSQRLKNATEIREYTSRALDAAEAMEEVAGEMISHLRKVGQLDPGVAPLVENTEGIGYALSELKRDLGAETESLVDDPDALASIESRLTLLGDLKMRYGRTLEEVLDFRDATAARVSELRQLLERSETIDSDVDAARESLARVANDLSKARQSTAKRLAKATEEHLRDLALGTASVEFEFESQQPGPRGADRAMVLFASHDSLEPGDLARVASGGELSRLVLAISLATGPGRGATVVFDEIDSGVGGATALAMARKLAELGRSHQVLCVTHLPQVAAFAATHFVVTREGGAATVERRTGEARLTELSRMIAGLPDSERGQQAAAELLELASSWAGSN